MLVIAGRACADPPAPATQPAPQEMGQEHGGINLTDPTDGRFDVSPILASPGGFLPLVVPITEPAIGYGLGAAGLFFHEKPQTVAGENGEPSRLIIPTSPVVGGFGTDNGSWGAFAGHLGVYDKGNVIYTGAVLYASLNLKWYGIADQLGNNPIRYNIEPAGTLQQLKFRVDKSNWYVGGKYTFAAVDSSFDTEGPVPGITSARFDSRNAGLGLLVEYDSLDQPFCPTRGIKSQTVVTAFEPIFGGDFGYGDLDSFLIGYLPLADNVTLGLRGELKYASGDVPFYGLPYVSLRGVPAGRFVDNVAMVGEAELRWDFTTRWSAVAFGGVGGVAPAFDELDSTKWVPAIGGGFRYLIAREYGLRIGLDVAVSKDDAGIYVAVGTGWFRP
jgi:hypothetical protein